MQSLKEIFISFPLRFVLILSLLTSLCLSSRRIIKITKLGVTRENPCNIDALGTFLPKSKLKRTGSLSKPKVREMCPNLVYTCCNESMINTLTNDLKMAFSSLKIRNLYLKKLFMNVKEYNLETYSLFLDEVSKEDITCFNNMKTEYYNEVEKKYQDEKQILKRVKKEKRFSLFKKEKLLANYSNLREMVDPLLKLFDERLIKLQTYYSSFICSMCSPEFTKIFDTDRNPPVLNVSTFFCKEILQKKAQFIHWKTAFIYVQQMVDLAFCVKKNSKPEKDFGTASWRDIIIFNSNSEEMNIFVKKLNHCLNEPEAFTSFSNIDNKCMTICQENMAFPKVKLVSIHRLDSAGAEFYNMYISSTKALTALERSQQISLTFEDDKQEIIDKGILETTSTDVVYLNFIRQVKNPPIDFTKIKLNISLTNSMSPKTTNMTPEFYQGIHLFKTAVLFLLICLLK